MRLYHFSPSNFAFQNIRRRRLKVATIDDLNDPFELLSAAVPTKTLRKSFYGFKAQMHKVMGVICFCPTWDNPVMWSHYADKHKGVALGFDVPDELAVPIKYVGGRSGVARRAERGNMKLGEEFAFELMTSKFKGWQYEKERRLYINLDERDAETGLYFYQFGDNLKLREVILGARCLVSKADADSQVSTFDPQVSVTVGRLSFRMFRVVPNLKHQARKVRLPPPNNSVDR